MSFRVKPHALFFGPILTLRPV